MITDELPKALYRQTNLTYHIFAVLFTRGDGWVRWKYIFIIYHNSQWSLTKKKETLLAMWQHLFIHYCSGWYSCWWQKLKKSVANMKKMNGKNVFYFSSRNTHCFSQDNINSALLWYRTTFRSKKIGTILRTSILLLVLKMLLNLGSLWRLTLWIIWF